MPVFFLASFEFSLLLICTFSFLSVKLVSKPSRKYFRPLFSISNFFTYLFKAGKDSNGNKFRASLAATEIFVHLVVGLLQIFQIVEEFLFFTYAKMMSFDEPLLVTFSKEIIENVSKRIPVYFAVNLDVHR